MGHNSNSDVMGTRVGWGASHAGEISATLTYFDFLSYINLNPEQGSPQVVHFWFCLVSAICQKTPVFFVFPVLAVHKLSYF